MNLTTIGKGFSDWLSVLILALPAVGLVMFIGTDPGGGDRPRSLGLWSATDSVTLAAVATVLAVALGVVLAIALDRVTTVVQRPLAWVLTLPIVCPSYCMAFAWAQVLEYSGVAVTPTAVDSAFGRAATVGVWATSAYPIAFWFARIGYRQWQPDWTAAAWLVGQDGAGIRRRFLGAMALPAGLLTALWLLGDFAVPDFFLVRTVATEVFADVAGSQDWRAAGWRIVPVLMLGVGGLWVLHRHQKRWASWAATRPATPHRFTTMFSALVITCTAAVVLVAVPLAALVATASSGPRLVNALGLAADLAETLRLWAVTAVIALPLAGFTAWTLCRDHRSTATWVRALACLMWVLPASAIGIGLSYWPVLTGLPLLALALGLAVKWSWLVLELMVGVLAGCSREREEASHLVGHGPARTRRAIVWPQVRTALVAAALMLLVVVGQDLTLSVLLGPPGFSSLPLRIFSTVHYDSPSALATLCLAEMTMAFLVGLATLALMSRRSTLSQRYST